MKNQLKVSLFSLFFILAFSGSSLGQKNTEADSQQLKNLIKESFDEVFSNLDASKMDEFYTDDFLLLEDGLIWNRDTISSYLEKHIAAQSQGEISPKRLNTFEFIEIRTSDKMAWIAYKNKAVWKHEETVYGEANWVESAVAVLTKDGWRLQLLHSTPVENE